MGNDFFRFIYSFISVPVSYKIDSCMQDFTLFTYLSLTIHMTNNYTLKLITKIICDHEICIVICFFINSAFQK